MNSLNLRVNGRQVTVEAAPAETLAEVLRERLGLTGVKVGCGTGECGACTVLLDGKPVASCITPAAKAEGRELLTVEGLAGPDGALHPIQKAFLSQGAIQCGFCTPGFLLAAKALLDENPAPTDDEIRQALTGHLCRCTGYGPILAAVRQAAAALREGSDIPLDLGEGLAAIGQAPVRKDGVDKVTGAFRFGADRDLPGMAHAVAVFSEHPYAELLGIDVDAASARPGVIAVLTATDVPGRKTQGIIIPDQPIFVAAGERVRSVGDVLALVIAETEAIARAAAREVRVAYRPLRGVFSPAEALAPGAPILHPRPDATPSLVLSEAEGNVMYATHVEKGDVDAAFSLAGVILEGVFRTPFAEHAYLEPEAGIAAVDDEGVVTVWMASQAITIHRFMVAGILGLPPDKVRLVHVPPGGAFGARNDLSLHPYLALAALRTGRPVKVALTRAESLRFHVKRHAMEHTICLAAARDGRLTGLICDIVADTGAYASAGIPVLDQATLFAAGPYDIPNVRIKGLSVYTNNIACGAMRGFGIPQSAFAIESLMDELAERLGISPFELRRINGLRPGSATATGQVLKASVPFVATLDRVEAALERCLTELPPPEPGHTRGVGVASCYKNVGLGLGLPEQTGVIIELTPAGRILVRVGGAELGQGSDTALAQIAAQALGVPYALVDLLACDTADTPDGGITSASRTTFMSGNAIVEAAALFLARLRAAHENAAEHPERSGRVVSATQSKGAERSSHKAASFDSVRHTTPDSAQDASRGIFRAVTAEALAALAARLAVEGQTLSVSHTYNPPRTFPLEARGEGEGVKFVSFSYATQAAIVDVDEATGEAHVRQMIAAHDVGRTINPLGAAGQIAGSCVMGLGYALSEELILDRGQLATETLAAVGIPVMKDAPPVEVLLVEDPDPAGPFGAKGIAEAAAIPSAPAILNAIHGALGVRIRQLPATPDRVVAALK